MRSVYIHHDLNCELTSLQLRVLDHDYSIAHGGATVKQPVLFLAPASVSRAVVCLDTLIDVMPSGWRRQGLRPVHEHSRRVPIRAEPQDGNPQQHRPLGDS